MKGNELRAAYLQFFQDKDHLIQQSYPLIPDNDPSLLLIGAGMAPLKPFFTGKLVPPKPRIATCHKCIRTGDVENVGRTARHHTFFEMLGNFSFGDYFKKEAIHWAWEFLTEVIKLDKDRLYVTVYPEDDEAYTIWKDEIGLDEDRISRLEDNFWEIGEGPCGPDSEIFYDLGEKRGCGSPTCAPGCDCDRYLEIWNLVFTQFDKTQSGEYVPLAKKNIDTGAGLERLASVLQNKETNFETDLLFPIIEKTMELAKVGYHESEEKDVSLKVIADHTRAITVMIGDGVLPSNEGRGYVLRRLLRRAVRHGRLLGIEGIFLCDLVEVVVDILGEGLTDLAEKQGFIKKVVQNEEERFNQTLAQGLELLRELIREVKDKGVNRIPGTEVFKLYDTYGFPWELTEEIAQESGLTLDMKGFEKAMEEQRTRAREAREELDAKIMVPDITHLSDSVLLADEECESSSLLLIGKKGVSVPEAEDGDEVVVIVEKTPFHAEGGGQLGDIGFMYGPLGKVEIFDTKKLPEGTVYHIGVVVEGRIQTGDLLRFEVDKKRRAIMAKNHTATHLLHAALRAVLGDHVTQAGSLVMPEKLRFDFTHFSAMTQEELDKVSRLVNEEIFKATNLRIGEMSMAQAKEEGAMALFGEKYGDVVRVVSVPGFSCELCGGTHVKNTAEIGSFRLLTESGIGSGIRRIEAITGEEALAAAETDRRELNEVAHLLKTKPHDILSRLEQVLKEYKALEQELAELRKEAAKGSVDSILEKMAEVKGYHIVASEVEAKDMEELRDIADMLRDKIKAGVVLLGAPAGDKVNFVCMATKDAVAAGAHCGNIIKLTAQAAGGNGGGRPDMAQAGGKNANMLSEALEIGKEAAVACFDK